MAQTRATLIFNPTAGDESQPTPGQLEALLNEAGYKVRIQSTADAGWSRALKKSADLIVVAGGDGTIGKVTRRLIGKGVPIAVLPLGTANNISKTLGIAEIQVTQLILSWKTAKRLKFDAGVAVGPWGERYFIEGVGAGLLTSSMPRVDKSKTLAQLPDKMVKVAYAQQLFREHLEDCPAIQIEATLDGNDISGCYLLFEALNMQYIGPNLFLAPEVARDNSEFDVVLIPEKHRRKLHDRIKNWQEGKSRSPEFITHRGKHLEINWTGFKIHIDDTIWPPGRRKRLDIPSLIDITVVPEAVEFLIPEEIHQMQQLARESNRA